MGNHGGPTPTPGRQARRLAPLAVAFVAVGLSTSFVLPYLALFLTEEVHAGPLRTTAYGMNLALGVVGLLLLIAAGRTKIAPRRSPPVIDGG